MSHPESQRHTPPGSAADVDPSSGDTARADSATDVAQLQRELQEAQDRVLRAQAELENMRRRMRREAEEERKFATQPLLTDLLSVLDNIQRAVQAAEKSPEGAGLLEGVRLVAQQLSNVLENHNCRRIAALGSPFDPQYHEALTQQPSLDYPPNTVMHVHQDGYQLHDRVIRPAQVVVSSSP
jgi:molecular chaperone GrpE